MSAICLSIPVAVTLLIVILLNIILHIEIYLGIIYGITFGGGFVSSIILSMIVWKFPIIRINRHEIAITDSNDLFQNGLRNNLKIVPFNNGARIDTSSLTSLLIEFKKNELVIKAAFTPSGWITVIFLILIGWGSIIATIIILVSLIRGSVQINDHRIIRLWASKPESTEDNNERQIIMRLLIKSGIIVDEATMARKSNKNNIMYGGILIGIIGLVYVWIGSYQSLGVGIKANFISSLIYGIIAGFLIAAPIIIGAYYKFRPQLIELGEWKSRINLAELREKSGSASNDAPMELLLEITRQLPVWNLYRAKAGYLFDQGSWISIGVLLLLGMGLTTSGMGPIGGILLVGALLVYYNWQKKIKIEQDKAIANWENNIQFLRAIISDE